MQMKRSACMAMVCILMLGMIVAPASAAEIPPVVGEIFSIDMVNPLATNSFSVNVPANTAALADTSFSMMAGETITIKASYAPFSASVDVGFIAPDGKFYYLSVTGGSVNQTIEVSQSGKYTIKIRNNSNAEIYVTGFVNY